MRHEFLMQNSISMKPVGSTRGAPVYLASPIDNEDDLDALYMWVDEFTLSRPKKSIARDFSDGVLAAEIVHTFFPKLVDLHNYHPASAIEKKVYNWNTLNQKVFKKVGFLLHPSDIKDVSAAKPFAIEKILNLLKNLLPELKAQYDANPLRNVETPASSSLPPGARSGASTAATGTRPLTGASAHGSVAHGYGHTPSSATPPSALPSAFPRAPTAPLAPSEFPPAGRGGLLSYDAELLEERDRTIEDLRDALARLQEKNARLEQLVKVKDSRIDALMQRLAASDSHYAR